MPEPGETDRAQGGGYRRGRARFGATQRRRLTTVLIVALTGALIGLGYGFVLSRGSQVPWDVADYRLSALSGFSIAGLTSAFELLWYQAPRGRWLHRSAFMVNFFVRVMILTGLIVLALVINRRLHLAIEGVDIADKFRASGGVWLDIVFSLAMLAIFIFVLQTVALVGGRTLRDFLLGRYYRPVEEERIFLFLDMKDSSKLAQKLGNASFHALLSDAFFVMDDAIVDRGGEVMSYVGDMVIATWPMGGPTDNARALIAVRDCLSRLDGERDRFDRVYGQAPEFRAVVNGGPVVVGETGDSKRQITYLGDVLNVTSRLEEVAKSRNVDFMATGALLRRTDVPDGFEATNLGGLPLRGIAEPVDAFAVTITGGTLLPGRPVAISQT